MLWASTRADDGEDVAAAPGRPLRAVPGPERAESFLRLVHGRLDDAADVTSSGVTLAGLKSVFPGF